MFIQLIKSWWRARQRSVDTKILWPAIKKKSTSDHAARTAMLAHITFDRAYSEMSRDELLQHVQDLP